MQGIFFGLTQVSMLVCMNLGFGDLRFGVGSVNVSALGFLGIGLGSFEMHPETSNQSRPGARFGFFDQLFASTRPGPLGRGGAWAGDLGSSS